MRRVTVKLRGLRQARQRSGLSISQLADLTGLRRDTITHLEHGKEDAQPYVLRRLAAALDSSSAELLGVAVLEPPTLPQPPARPASAPPDTITAAS
jgi:transcriptional regulator with XRE-family HTH domain